MLDPQLSKLGRAEGTTRGDIRTAETTMFGCLCKSIFYSIANVKLWVSVQHALFYNPS